MTGQDATGQVGETPSIPTHSNAQPNSPNTPTPDPTTTGASGSHEDQDDELLLDFNPDGYTTEALQLFDTGPDDHGCGCFPRRNRW